MKTYNGEKAIISLTSWKARINTVSKTLFSLVRRCPGFHIVLVLSEEEFPKKEKELPADVIILTKNDLIELCWVKRNYKSFKKVFFTMLKYPHVPIISADDDCLYKYNYANELYEQWLKNKKAVVSFYGSKWKDVFITGGYATLYPPGLWTSHQKMVLPILDNLPHILNYGDDPFYAVLNHILHNTSYYIIGKPMENVCATHDANKPLHDTYKSLNRDTMLLDIEHVITLAKYFITTKT